MSSFLEFFLLFFSNKENYKLTFSNAVYYNQFYVQPKITKTNKYKMIFLFCQSRAVFRAWPQTYSILTRQQLAAFLHRVPLSPGIGAALGGKELKSIPRQRSFGQLLGAWFQLSRSHSSGQQYSIAVAFINSQVNLCTKCCRKWICLIENGRIIIHWRKWPGFDFLLFFTKIRNRRI